jgi:iron-sulfur cluster repair protein YtfE (RIC family)
MKRHESLAPLSREHHEALILAQILKKNAPAYKGLPQTLPGKVKYALVFFNNHLKKHFQQEEQMLNKVKHCDTRIAEITREIIAEHEQLTLLFNNLHDELNVEATMDTLGHALDAHIRKEERVLFPLIQEACPENILNTLELK